MPSARIAGGGGDHELLVAGRWTEGVGWAEVRSPYDGALLGRVAQADERLASRAIEEADRAFETADFPQHRRAAMLERAARLTKERAPELAHWIAAESGKPLKSALDEAARCSETLLLSAVEARRLTGETVPMDATASGEGKLGVVLRVPCGVVGAISPFNFPLNLVAHKLGPAIAAGNPVVLKPAEQTPITALKLARILVEAGLPDGWLSVVPGPGREIGGTLVTHPLVKALTFTGSASVGWGIRARAPNKKVLLELGSNAPLVVDADSDWEAAADKVGPAAFAHAGQVCISVQRILLQAEIADRFVARLKSNIASLKVGDPLDPDTDVGPLITIADRERVESWVAEAVGAGAGLICGGELVDQGRCLAPTLLGAPPKDSKVWREEAFGPIATVDTFDSFAEGLAMANDSHFGLQAGVFTRSLAKALEAGRALRFGGIVINDVPSFRADLGPYGGVKDSGNTREGPAYAVRELTEERFLLLQGGEDQRPEVSRDRGTPSSGKPRTRPL